MSLYEKCSVLTAFSNSTGNVETKRSSRLSSGSIPRKRGILCRNIGKLTFLLGMASLHFSISDAASHERGSEDEKYPEPPRTKPSTVQRPLIIWRASGATPKWPRWANRGRDIDEFVKELEHLEQSLEGPSFKESVANKESSTALIPHKWWVEDKIRDKIADYRESLQKRSDELNDQLDRLWDKLGHVKSVALQDRRYWVLSVSKNKIDELIGAYDHLLQYEAELPSTQPSSESDDLPPTELQRGESIHHPFGPGVSQRVGQIKTIVPLDLEEIMSNGSDSGEESGDDISNHATHSDVSQGQACDPKDCFCIGGSDGEASSSYEVAEVGKSDDPLHEEMQSMMRSVSSVSRETIRGRPRAIRKLEADIKGQEADKLLAKLLAKFEDMTNQVNDIIAKVQK